MWRLLAAAIVGLLIFAATTEPNNVPGYRKEELWQLIDLGVGVLALPVLLLRRRFPIAVVVVLVTATAFTTSTIGSACIAVISLCTRRQWRQIIPTALGMLVTGAVFEVIHPSVRTRADEVAAVTISLLSVGICIAIGLFIGARRELLLSLHERAETAEREQTLRVAQARVGERARIAREMHDVLAHRISLVAMHSGALTFRDNLTSQEVRDTAGVIQENAHQALTEMRSVLGVLRGDEPPDGRPEAPQPKITDLPALIEDTRQYGEDVTLTATGTLDNLPDTLSRNVFRIVQECLTNARKHAPGQPVQVHLTGEPGDRVLVEVVNPTSPDGLQAGGRQELPRSGLGLIGLTERAVLSGGELRHGLDRSRRFVVSGWLPWERADAD